MVDRDKRDEKALQKAKVRKRYHAEIDPENYEYIPGVKPADYYDTDVHQRVAIYVRVSTDDVRQTTSYELQQKYYVDFVNQHPNWELVNIYADEGISGTSLKHRDAFNRMIQDCRDGKIDLIITKSVSRFARNVVICIGLVRELSEMKHPVGVFFESECIFSLNDESQMALSFQATMAEEESHTRSRSMEASLRMRLDNGIPLTPKLLGYTHDDEGNLVINPEEAPTVKLVFYMYLYGFSTSQIAKTLIKLQRRSYLGNIKWTPGGVVQILRNERHCGEVLTRKTYTPSYRDHLSKRNRGERPQSRYMNHHEAIISRDDFIAVQQMLNNAKYGNRARLPELRVIDSGFLKGYVTINPRWGGFSEEDYYQAAASVYSEGKNTEQAGENVGLTVEVAAGDFDMRGFEVARPEFFDANNRPHISFQDRKLKLSAACTRRFGAQNYIELLVNPIERKFAVRPTSKDNRRGVFCSKPRKGDYYPIDISASAFTGTLYKMFGWNMEYRYRIIGTLYEKDGEIAYIFDVADSVAYFRSFLMPVVDQQGSGETVVTPLEKCGKMIPAVPKQWAESFGEDFYTHEQSLAALQNQSEDVWKLHLQGRLYDSGKRLNVTSYSELQNYIRQETGLLNQEETDERTE